MRKISVALLVCIFVTVVFSAQDVYAYSGVEVVLPSFGITLNGTKIQNDSRQYPFIVYNGITYFPMTYYDCRYLGLETTWNSEDGLGIKKCPVSVTADSITGTAKNSRVNYASLPNFKITINGQKIDNSKEKYPLLVFRDVTYFPMTWRFCVDEFGWKYSFDNTNGLVITSDNPKVEKVKLSECMGRFISTGSYYVYVGANGCMYKAPIADTSKYSYSELLNKDAEDAGFVCSDESLSKVQTEFYPSLYEENGEIAMLARYGTASMGGVTYCTVSKDGDIVFVAAGRDEIKKYGNIFVKNYYGVIGPVVEDLFVNDLSSNQLICSIPVDGDNILYFGDFELVGREIYYCAYKGKINTDHRYEFSEEGIYKTNIDTKKNTKLFDHSSDDLHVADNNLYYQYDGAIYKKNLDNNSGDALKVSSATHSECFEVLNNNIYCRNDKDDLYVNDVKQELTNGRLIDSIQKSGNYIVCTFRDDKYKVKGFSIYDVTGEMVFISEEDVEFQSMYNGIVCFSSTVDSNLYTVNLK